MTTSRIAIALSAAATIALAGCGSSSDEATTENSPASKMSSTADASATSETATDAATTDTATGESTSAAGGSDAAAGAGMYLTQADYEAKKANLAGNKTVYFFAAKWCPSCQAADKELTASGVPDGITVVNIDFDSNGDLKKKYGITQQHTFVQIDDSGNELKKWSGSVSGADIEKKVA